jgi:hypothetical protein
MERPSFKPVLGEESLSDEVLRVDSGDFEAMKYTSRYAEDRVGWRETIAVKVRCRGVIKSMG